MDPLACKGNFNYNADKRELEKKISDATDFLKKAKVTELENKIPNISKL